MHKKQNSFWIMMLLILLISSVVPTVSAEQNPQDIEIIKSDQYGITIHVSLPLQSFQIETVKEQGQDYSKVSLSGWDTISRSGEPQLPFRALPLAVPAGTRVSLKVTPEKYHTMDLDAPVIPGISQHLQQDSSILDTETTPSFTFSRNTDSSVYDSPQAYPGEIAKITNQGLIRNQKVANISIYPFQFHSKSSTLTVFESFFVQVDFQEISEIDKGVKQTNDPIFESLFEGSLINYDKAIFSGAATEQILPDQIENEVVTSASPIHSLPWQTPSPDWRIAVDQDGIYQLTYDDLFVAGVLDTSPDPRNFQMFYQGEPVPIQVRGEGDGSFDPDDLILFFGQSINTKYTDENIYWLTIGESPGTRINSRSGAPNSAATVDNFTNEKHYEENNYYWTLFPGDDTFERFYWDSLNNYNKLNWIFDFPLPNAIAGQAYLSLSLVGYSNTMHYLRVFINNTEVSVGEISFNGIVPQTFEIDITGLLVAGNNELKLTNTTSSEIGFDIFLIDGFKLEFLNAFRVENDQLIFNYEDLGSWLFSVDEFSNNQITVFDITNPNNIVEIKDTVIKATGAGYSVDFEDNLSSEKKFTAVAEPGLHSVLSIRRDLPSNLQSLTNQADYILITPNDFWEEAHILTDYRESQGLSVMRVRLQDIYDEFNGGVADANAIHSFLQYAYENWQEPAPAYVLLLGDGHYDPKDHIGYGRESFIPPFLAVVDPWIGETASDNRYVTISGDDTMPDMMIGRLPVNSPAEAETVINKIIAYEQSPESGDWNQQVLAVADNADSGGNFAVYSDNVINSHIPEAYQTDKVYLGVTHMSDIEAKAALIGHFNAGKLFINYIGHASYSAWAYEGLLSIDDIPALTNGGKQPIILAMTCYEGFFHRPYPLSNNKEALAEVVTRADNRGAIASWSPTGLGVANGHDYLNRGFFDAVFEQNVETLGEATLAGKFDLWATGTHFDLLDTYTLFGDPAQKINLSLSAVNDNYQTNEDTRLEISAQSGVLGNDYFRDPETTEVILVDTSQNGDLVLNSDGSFSYNPDVDWNGTDNFTYQLFDGEKYSNTAAVSITVISINDPPVAEDQTLYTMVNTPVNITLTATDDGHEGSSPFSIDDPVSRAALIYSIVDQPLSGILINMALPELTYQPEEGFVGSDSFTFLANDWELQSNEATVTIIVQEEQVEQILYLPLIIK